MNELPQQILNGLSLGAIYALIALGYTMVYGVLRFINFAHGDVYMIGAFAGFYIGPRLIKGLAEDESVLSWSPPFAQGSIAGAACVILLSMAVAAFLGILIERLAYRPLRNRPRLTVLITAIGVSIFLEYTGQFVFGPNPKFFPPLVEMKAFEGTGDHITITNIDVLVWVSTIALLLALRFIVMKTKMGMAMRALSFNPTACSLMGVNNNVIISFTFGLGSALAAAAGILSALMNPSIDPLMGISVGVKAFVAAVLGGIGNIPGAALGGFIIGIVETMVVGYISPAYKEAVAFAVLILILLLRPTGLLGKNVSEKV